MIIKNNTIIHLTHSCNLIKIYEKVLIFDYPEVATNLLEEIVGIDNLVEEDVYVFVSHTHLDHYNKEIFKWKNRIKKISYIISSDVDNVPSAVHIIKENEKIRVNDLMISTYPSSDQGVAFSIYIKDKHIYYGGDNAFWNFDGDISEDDYVDKFLSPIDRSVPIDFAFQPCDPRLDGNGEGGIKAFAFNLTPEILIPLHLFDKFDFLQKIELALHNFQGYFWPIKKRGDILDFADSKSIYYNF